MLIVGSMYIQNISLALYIYMFISTVFHRIENDMFLVLLLFVVIVVVNTKHILDILKYRVKSVCYEV